MGCTAEDPMAGGNENEIEIKIKTLDSQIYTMRVNKQVPVPDLKQQISTVTGVLADQQRLICRGKVLKDDQRLSAYYVEDGHTLHLVTRQPIPPSSESSQNQTDTVPGSGMSHQHDNQVAAGLHENSNVRNQSDAIPPVINQPFKRYVEIGRVALVNYGKDYGRLVVIVDVIDQNRALVDAPDMVRCQMNFKRLSLTDIKIDIKRVPKKKTLIEAMNAADVQNKWDSSSWGRKLIVQKRRAALTDFDRFKIMLAKIKRGGVIRQELAKLKKQTAS